jgi:hypothetical protein
MGLGCEFLNLYSAQLASDDDVAHYKSFKSGLQELLSIIRCILVPKVVRISAHRRTFVGSHQCPSPTWLYALFCTLI